VIGNQVNDNQIKRLLDEGGMAVYLAEDPSF